MPVLSDVDFGLGAAQQERHLGSFFYRSGAFEQAASERITVVLGAKGAGKSAIFRMFAEFGATIAAFRPPNLYVLDEPQLRDHASALRAADSIGASIALWRFYIASLLAHQVLAAEDAPADAVKPCARFLARWGLVQEIPTAWQTLRRIRIGIGISDVLKAEFPPSSPLSTREIDIVLHVVNNWLDDTDRDLWICMDSLDEVTLNGGAANDSEELLSDLMKAVGEIIRLRRLRFKLFFRTDQYAALTYVNKDHFSASKLELRWTKEDLVILLAHRLAPLYPEHDDSIRYADAVRWVDDFFDWSELVPTFDGLCDKLRDGNGDVLPRDLVTFSIEAQRLQQTYDIQGVNAPSAGHLVSTVAVDEALRITAEAKLHDFLQVFSNLSRHYDRLKGHDTRRLSREDVMQLFGIVDPYDAQLVISDLVRIGALAIVDRKAVGQAQSFEIPYLYARALQIGEQHG